MAMMLYFVINREGKHRFHFKISFSVEFCFKTFEHRNTHNQIMIKPLEALKSGNLGHSVGKAKL